jgi:hypothetical protein
MFPASFHWTGWGILGFGFDMFGGTELGAYVEAIEFALVMGGDDRVVNDEEGFVVGVVGGGGPIVGADDDFAMIEYCKFVV